MSTYKPTKNHLNKTPVSRYDDLKQAFIDGAVNNSFGRPVNVMYEGPSKVASMSRLRGSHDALSKFASMSEHLWELGGLGMLMGIPGYELYKDFKENRPTEDKVLHGTELAGLGVLGVPSLQHLLKR